MKIRHLLAAAAVLGWMALPAPAAACPLLVLDARTIAAADVAFVGVVQRVENRVAVIGVVEVWRGPDLPGEVDVVVGDGQPAGLSTGDRSFDVGQRYLVVPLSTPDGLQDNVCSLTRPWSDELAILRPATARPPTATDGVAVPIPLLIAIGAAAVIAGFAFVLGAEDRPGPKG